MDTTAAKYLIKNTFPKAFSLESFRLLVINLLPGLDESKAFTHNSAYITKSKAYQAHISQNRRLGTYTTPYRDKLDVLAVRLKKTGSLERARTMQRNFVADYLKERGEKDAALVAYYCEGREDWRFSLVRLDYESYHDETADKVKTRLNLTPARRYSFLTGAAEPSHTVQRQLLPLLESTARLTLDALENAFTIESVGNAFFEEYKALFLSCKERLDIVLEKHSRIRREFTGKGIDSANFAKKLLGQIVFLYFLQKKGWLGVARDAAWGTGSKNFLRETFADNGQQNYFNDILEPLFYSALAEQRPDSFYAPLNCHIPFLNGGLFEPIGEYDWRTLRIPLENSLFQNIFKTFDLYNFTVAESEPLEKEVAVDPEMLGKVFERLLEVRDRKSAGAFYTPREVVQYICRESLIHYLDNSINIAYKKPLAPQKTRQGDIFAIGEPEQPAPQTADKRERIPCGEIAEFIHFSEFVIEQDRAKAEGAKSYTYRMPAAILKHAKAFDKALAEIKICDPAIGSGAFPVGMMQEIVKARTALSAHLGYAEQTEPGPYELKRQAIEKCLYGVDTDPAAVDIARLRLWLSLVVDEEDYSGIKPLPNLDYKIVRGDSLNSAHTLFNNQARDELITRQRRYFDITNSDEKHRAKAQIEQLLNKLTDGKRNFDYELYFSEVFMQNQGFDVVIGNPPYVRQEAIKHLKPQLKAVFPKFYSGTADLYTYFYCQGLHLLKRGGVLCYIAPNKFMRAAYGKKTRLLLTQEAELKVLIDFGDTPVFDATTYPAILLLEKLPGKAEQTARVTLIEDKADIPRIAQTVRERSFSMAVSDLELSGWILDRPEVLALMKKLRKAGQPLQHYVKGRFYRGILTGFNEAFVIDEAARQRLIEEDPRSEELIKPWLRGKDIKKWQAQWAGLYLLAIPSSANRHWPWSDAKMEDEAREIFKDTFPAVEAHLSQWEGKLVKRADQGKFWWELRACAYYEEFDKSKIIIPAIAHAAQYLADHHGFYSNDKTSICVTDDVNYLLALLNSKVLFWFIKQIAATKRGGYYEFKPMYVSQLPIPLISSPEKKVIETLVEYILYLARQPFAKSTALDSTQDRLMLCYFEQILDGLVYELYFPEELHAADKHFLRPLQAEKLQLPATLADDTGKLDYLRKLFIRLYDKEHAIRINLFFLDSLETVRIIEGKK
ncbi:MAG: class I SAM-dependent DNA methyltransferase [Gammaproteobacteria bacterium]|nr:class I SAM-dependent DNA methyltransferase [Gammaproteobacteria bacterium]